MRNPVYETQHNTIKNKKKNDFIELYIAVIIPLRHSCAFLYHSSEGEKTGIIKNE